MIWTRYYQRWLILLLLVLLSACGGPAQPAPPAATTTAAISAQSPPTSTVEAATAAPEATAAPTATAASEATAAPTITPAASSGQPDDPSAPAFSRTLQVENPPLTGPDVDAVWDRLIKLGYANIEIWQAGYTENLAYVVRNFQWSHGLEADGIVGPLTWERLFSRLVDPEQPISPIVRVTRSSGMLLGSLQNDRWIDAVLTSSLLQGGEQYRVYALDRELASTSGAASLPSGMPPCEMLRTVEFDPQPAQEAQIALIADWEVLPRIPEQLALDNETYRQALREFLLSQGLTDPDLELTALLRVDLEGDGSDEVLLAATHLSAGILTPRVAAGDYSVVLLRRVADDGSVETLPLAVDIHLEAVESQVPQEFSLVGAFDSNGDGALEILVDSAYYEGRGTDVYSLEAGELNQIQALSVFCGV